MYFLNPYNPKPDLPPFSHNGPITDYGVDNTVPYTTANYNAWLSRTNWTTNPGVNSAIEMVENLGFVLGAEAQHKTVTPPYTEDGAYTGYDYASQLPEYNSDYDIRIIDPFFGIAPTSGVSAAPPPDTGSSGVSSAGNNNLRFGVDISQESPVNTSWQVQPGLNSLSTSTTNTFYESNPPGINHFIPYFG
ncbi:MAG: hypothetical protein AAGI66_00135 [Cyanobacteria bacterium P01_H01_bin.74]